MAPIDQATLNLPKKLETLSSNQSKWAKTTYSDKLALLEEVDRLASTIPAEEWKKLGEWTSNTMMGFRNDTSEGKLVASAEAGMTLLVFKQCLTNLISSYKMVGMTNSNAKTYEEQLKPKTSSVNGQVFLDVFPMVPADKFGPYSKLKVQWFLDPKVTEKDAPEPFSIDHFDEKKEDGVLVVLGAGNQSFLTMNDALEALFVRQRVVLVKQHPLRAALDDLMRQVFKPLYDAGFLESVLDLGREGNSSLVYHPLVTGIHMTGGKATHDAIV